MLAKLFLQYMLAAMFGVGLDTGYATVYGTPGDTHAGGDMACTHVPVPQDQPVCAHRWLPCGTQVLIVNLERPAVTSCRVTDRGPFGVSATSGKWRGVIDLTPYAARQAHLDGRDLVRLIYSLPPPDSRVYGNRTFLVPRKRGPGPNM